MFKAIHKESGLKLLAYRVFPPVNIGFVEIPRDNDKPLRILNPHNEKWIAPEEEIVWDKKPEEIEVRIKKKHPRTTHSGKIIVMPHFFIPNRKKRNIKTRSMAKHEKLSRCVEGILVSSIDGHINPPINLIDGKNKIPLSPDRKFVKEFISSSFNVKWEERENSYGISNQADILLNFDRFHPRYGWGICFEVDLRNEDREDKERDWFKKGYSIAWISENMFDETNKSIPSIKSNEIFISTPYSISLSKLKKKIRDSTIDCIGYIEEKKEEVIRNISTETNEKAYFLENKSEEVAKSIENKYVDGKLKDLSNFMEKIEMEREYLKGFFDKSEEKLIESIFSKLDKQLQQRCASCKHSKPYKEQYCKSCGTEGYNNCPCFRTYNRKFKRPPENHPLYKMLQCWEKNYLENGRPPKRDPNDGWNCIYWERE